MMLLFGDITGIIIKYVENSYNETLNVTERYVLDQNLIQDGVDFAIAFSGVGVLLIITTYITSILLAFSTVRQVGKKSYLRHFENKKKFFETISYFKTIKNLIYWKNVLDHEFELRPPGEDFL